MKEKAIVVTADNRAFIRDIEVIDGSMLNDLWAIVDGYIEIVRPTGLEEPLCLVCDEEGLLKGKALNVFASLVYGVLDHGNPIVGDVVILHEGFRDGEPDLVGIPDDSVDGLYNRILAGYSFLRGEDA